MRFISWNVNGLRAILKKDFYQIFDQFGADVFAIQETKCQPGQVDLDLPGYHQFYSYAQKKGYSGTAVFCKEEPLCVLHGIGEHYLDQEGRVTALEFDDIWFVNVYTPNSQSGLARIDHRMQWDDAFRDFCKGLEEGTLPGGVPYEMPRMAADGTVESVDQQETEAVVDFMETHDVDSVYDDMLRTSDGQKCDPKSVVICGDFNVARLEIDLKHPDSHRGDVGFSDEERGKSEELLAAGFIDTFRYLHPDLTDKYSWWSYKYGARKTNAGWRLDYFFVSDSLKDRIESASIYDEVMGSDHCPVGLELRLD